MKKNLIISNPNRLSFLSSLWSSLKGELTEDKKLMNLEVICDYFLWIHYYWPWQIHFPPFQAEHFFFLHFFFFFLSPIRIKIYFLILLEGNSLFGVSNLKFLSIKSFINFISKKNILLKNKFDTIFLGCILWTKKQSQKVQN